MINDLPLPVSPVSRLSPGPKRTADSATSARSRTFNSLSKLFLGDQWPAPAQLVGQVLIEALRRAEPDHLQALRVRPAADHVADRHLMSASLTVDAHLAGPTHDGQADLLAWREY